MVHIRRVEIYGFKSFGFKNTVVEFEPGLVSISGANGSGKSNILDAITFAGGEDRAKAMRAGKLRELVHDVEGARGGHRVARVSVHLDNSDRRIPVDSDSVEITREMTPRGESTYELNRKRSSRGQISGLLEVANADLHQLNSVKQGTVTRIAEFSPDEKRQSIEDQVGISAFDEKKAQAQKQLEEADNRLRVSLATMTEIKAQIDDLEVQRNRQLRHDLLAREIGRLRAVVAAGDLRRTSALLESKGAELEAAGAEAAGLRERAGAARAESERLEAERAAFLDEMGRRGAEKARVQEGLRAAIEAQQRASSEAAVARRRGEAVGARLAELRAARPGAEAALASADEGAAAAREALSGAAAERGAIEEEISRVDAVYEAALARQAEEAARRDEAERAAEGLRAQARDAELSAAKAEQDEAAAAAGIAANSKKLRACEEGLASLRSLRGRLEAAAAARRGEAEGLRSRVASLRARKARMESDAEGLSEMLEKAASAGARHEARIRTAEGLMQEDYSAARIRADRRGPGVLGLAYEVLSWDPEHERAVMASGADWLKALVVRDFDALIAVAEHARRAGLPKVRIVPLDAMPALRPAAPGIPGVLGPLSDRVRCGREYEPLRAFIFGGTVLARDRAAARAASAAGYKAVTPEGDAFEPAAGAAVVDAGSRIADLARIVSTSASVRGLLESAAMLRRYIGRQRAAARRVEASIAAHEEGLRAAEAALAQAEGGAGDHEGHVAKAEALRDGLSSRIAALGEARRIAGARAEAGRLLARSAAERLAAAPAAPAAGGAGAEEIAAAAEAKAALSSRHSGALAEHGRLSEEASRAAAAAAGARAALEAARSEEASLSAEAGSISSRLAELGAEEEALGRELVGLRESEQRVISEQGGSTGQISEYDGRLRELGAEERDAARLLAAAQRRADALSRDASELGARRASLQQTLDAYGAVDDCGGADVGAALRALSAEQASLGPLNALAPSKYAKISGEYRSMSERKNSLEGERNSIVRFIEGVERDKRQAFLDAFDTVDREVRGIFSKMTGGSAWLELENEDDIFEGGISYMIQFRNKQRRESSSISGGEKTLAAIVFVLALQQLRPSPFYLFDEVDAHLDAPNSERLAGILEERSRESQFIMVSLKDSVVSRASLIYGVYPRGADSASQVVRYRHGRPAPG